MTAGTTSFPTLEGFDPFGTGFLNDPVHEIQRAQTTAPVFYYEPLRMWVVTKYDDICKAARDWETFSSKATGMVPPPDDLKSKIPDTFVADHYISLDPPEHTGDRTAVARNFLPRELQKQEASIRRIANTLIDGFIAKGSCDFMQEFCYPLSLGVIMGLLGVPPERAADYRIWTEDLFSVLTPKSKDAVTKPMSEEERRERWTRLCRLSRLLRQVGGGTRQMPDGGFGQRYDASERCRRKSGRSVAAHHTPNPRTRRRRQ